MTLNLSRCKIEGGKPTWEQIEKLGKAQPLKKQTSPSWNCVTHLARPQPIQYTQRETTLMHILIATWENDIGIDSAGKR